MRRQASDGPTGLVTGHSSDDAISLRARDGMLLSRRYIVVGRVQGVGFRYFTEAAATREGLHGWVTNRPDGSVEICAEGDSDAIRRFEYHVRQGPPGARVETVEVDEQTPTLRVTGFTVK